MHACPFMYICVCFSRGFFFFLFVHLFSVFSLLLLLLQQEARPAAVHRVDFEKRGRKKEEEAFGKRGRKLNAPWDRNNTRAVDKRKRKRERSRKQSLRWRVQVYIHLRRSLYTPPMKKTRTEVPSTASRKTKTRDKEKNIEETLLLPSCLSGWERRGQSTSLSLSLMKNRPQDKNFILLLLLWPASLFFSTRNRIFTTRQLSGEISVDRHLDMCMSIR